MLQHSTSEKPKNLEMNNKIHNFNRFMLVTRLSNTRFFKDKYIFLSTSFGYLKPNDKNFISRRDFVVKVRIDDSKVEVI